MSNDTITLLDGITWNKNELLANMDSDLFYYGHLSKAALSSSACKDLLRSSKSYYKSLSKEQKDTPALREGRLFHTLVLEPEKMQQKYEFFDAEKRTATFNKAYEACDRELMLKKEFYFMRALKKNIDRCEYANGLLQDGLGEVPAIDFINDIPFRGKADYLRNNHIVDLKTTASLDGWEYTAKKKWHYDMQAFIYRHLFNVERFTFLVIEKITGEIGIFESTEEFFQSGEEKVHLCTDRYKEDFFGKSDDEIEAVVFNRYIHGSI